MELEKSNNKSIRILSHTLVWIVLFVSPYFLAAGEDYEILRILKYSTIPLVFYIVIFYTNYLIFIDRLWFSTERGYFILLNVVMVSVFVFLNYKIKHTYFLIATVTTPKPFKLFIYLNLVSMIIPLIFAIALKTYEKWITFETHNRQANNEKLISELEHLRYQLQPHFFFNSLNNIYSLIDHYPDQAKETVHSLSKLMRYLLYETNVERIPLNKEIDFMKRYIELMKLRVSENITIHEKFPVLNDSMEIPPLLFISLIENAFKHGVSAKEKSDIYLELGVQKNKILFSTQNLYIPKDITDKSGSGIGINNLKKRLTLLYPDKFVLTHEIKDGIYYATMSIQLY